MAQFTKNNIDLIIKVLNFWLIISKLSFRFRIINTKVTESSWLGQSEVIVSLYKANGYDSPPAVPFTFLPRPRNVKCRGRVLRSVPKTPRYDQRADASP